MTNSSTEQFVRLLVASEHDLYFYAFSLLANADDAKDVVQDAAVAMWQRFEEFDASRPFMPWASRFVYFSALTFIRHRRRAALLLTEEALDAIAAKAAGYSAQPRLKALTACLDRLPPPSRRLMVDRYQHSQSIKQIARLRRMNLRRLYRAFERIRMALQECIERTLVQEETA